MIFKIVLIGWSLFVLNFVCAAKSIEKPSAQKKTDIPTMDFLHFWISQGEVNAMHVFKDAFIHKGGIWNDTSTNNYQLMKIEASIRESKGFPVGSMLVLGGNDIQYQTRSKRIQPIENIIENSTWESLLQPFTIDALRINHKMMAIPFAIHNENWAWYNTQIYEDLNLSLPTNWEVFLSQAPLIEKAGYLPIAMSDDYFSLRIFFSVLIASVGGKDVYQRFFAKQDATVLDDKKFQKALNIFSRIRRYRVHKKYLYLWSDAAHEVINGNAAMLIMGDWAKAEFQIAHMVLDKDYICRPAPGADRYFLAAIDTVTFPYVQSSEEKAGQTLFAHTLLEKEVQTRFNRLKGSTPAITNFDINAVDKCTRSRLSQLKHKENILYSPRLLTSESRLSYIRKCIADFWIHKEISVEKLIDNFKKVF